MPQLKNVSTAHQNISRIVVMLPKSYKSDYDIGKTQVLNRLSHFDKLGSEFYLTSKLEEKYKC